MRVGVIDCYYYYEYIQDSECVVEDILCGFLEEYNFYLIAATLILSYDFICYFCNLKLCVLNFRGVSFMWIY